MKKIGILTLDGIVNYGNRLQNYALQTILEKEGFKVDTIIAKGSIVKPIVSDIRTILKTKKRAINFIKFNREYINIHRIFAQNWNISTKLSDKYDYFVVGSDQVWNPNIRKRERNNYFLKFAKPEQRISVAASFSVNQIAESDSVVFSEGINGFKSVSVREYEGAEIVKEICGRDAVVLCDPTLMVNIEEWDKMATLPKIKLPEKYLLTYFLGEVSEMRKQEIKEFAEAHQLEIISLNDIKYSKIYESGPREFIGLIKNAVIVCSDSFHGVAFSIIYNIPFWAFKRESTKKATRNMESRITSLQKKLGISGRLIDKLLPDMKIEYDYTAVNKQLHYERRLFTDFLREALDR